MEYYTDSIITTASKKIKNQYSVDYSGNIHEFYIQYDFMKFIG